MPRTKEMQSALEDLLNDSNMTNNFRKDLKSFIFHNDRKKYAFQIINKKVSEGKIQAMNKFYEENGVIPFYILPTNYFKHTIKKPLSNSKRDIKQKIKLRQAEKTIEKIFGTVFGKILYFNKDKELEKPTFSKPKSNDYRICTIRYGTNVKTHFNIVDNYVFQGKSSNANDRISKQHYYIKEEPDKKIDLSLPSFEFDGKEKKKVDPHRPRYKLLNVEEMSEEEKKKEEEIAEELDKIYYEKTSCIKPLTSKEQKILTQDNPYILMPN